MTKYIRTLRRFDTQRKTQRELKEHELAAKHEPRLAKVRFMSTRQTAARKVPESAKKYEKFQQLDGQHPWMTAVPEGFITYPVRVLPKGRVAYFNFSLAKEMGLIAQNHPEKITSELHAKLIDTFCLRIVNEYDQQHHTRFPESTRKPKPYMATRYLQLQHKDKTGRTSGDGRGIWNGTVEHGDKTWDVSSRGTGVTALAPGSVNAGKPLRTGAETVGYGCGLAEIDELFGSVLMSEVFHRQGIKTERTLVIIETGSGVGIGVRAAPNLLRPAHLFNHLKQGNFAALKRATDYLIDRQNKNGEWTFSAQSARRYDLMLEEITRSYADFVAVLDVDYIFAWLDWDGDNCLATGGIIDYGSIRQFGLRHDQYRYDDVERYSTNLNEQKLKAKQIVQVFAQLVDYLKSGEKKSLQDFRNHSCLELFDRTFTESRLQRILHRVGFDQENCSYLLHHHHQLVSSFARDYDFLERVKTHRPARSVTDGINRPAIYNMRNLLRTLPEFLKSSSDFAHVKMSDQQLFRTLRARGLRGKDTKPTSLHILHARNLQLLYKQLIEASRRRRSTQRILNDLCEHTRKINNETRITGDSIIHIVDDIMAAYRKGLSQTDLNLVIQNFISDQCGEEHEAFVARKSHVAQLIEGIEQALDANKEAI